jgi:hypothetical protein
MLPYFPFRRHQSGSIATFGRPALPLLDGFNLETLPLSEGQPVRAFKKKLNWMGGDKK